MNEIESIVHLFLLKLVKKNNLTTVDLNQALIGDLGLSSLDIVLLITNTFKEFQIPMTVITEQDLRLISTGMDLVRLLAIHQTSI